MRYEAGLITCDGCSADITKAHLSCDRLDGEWCKACFGTCPCPPDAGPCEGEGCPTLSAEADSSEAQSLRDAVAFDAESLLANRNYSGLSPVVLGWIIRHILRDTGPIGAHIAKIEAERDAAREVVALCNNSFGSYSYHLSPHPAEQIERVKSQAGYEWCRANTAEAQVATLTARIADLEAALEAARQRFADIAAGNAFQPRLHAATGASEAQSVLKNQEAGSEWRP